MELRVTKAVHDLVVQSYNLKNKYVKRVGNAAVVNPIVMSIESSTVGFVQTALEGIVETRRNFRVGKYLVDMWIPEHRIAVECDEFDHRHYDASKELTRQRFIEEQMGCTFIRFNPCDKDFCLAKLINDILVKTTLPCV